MFPLYSDIQIDIKDTTYNQTFSKNTFTKTETSINLVIQDYHLDEPLSSAGDHQQRCLLFCLHCVVRVPFGYCYYFLWNEILGATIATATAISAVTAITAATITITTITITNI